MDFNLAWQIQNAEMVIKVYFVINVKLIFINTQMDRAKDALMFFTIMIMLYLTFLNLY